MVHIPRVFIITYSHHTSKDLYTGQYVPVKPNDSLALPEHNGLANSTAANSFPTATGSQDLKRYVSFHFEE